MAQNAPEDRSAMSFPELVSWAWRETPPVHKSTANLIIHIVAVPLFVLGHVLLVVGLFVNAWWLAGAALSIVVSLAAQRVGHSLEHNQVPVFTGAGDFTGTGNGDANTITGGIGNDVLDGGAGADKVAAAMRIILTDPNVKAVLFNIFGGITRCDEVARGILAAMDEVKPKVPMVVRLVGTNAEEGRKLLENANMITAETLADAAKKSVEAAKKGK